MSHTTESRIETAENAADRAASKWDRENRRIRARKLAQA